MRVDNAVLMAAGTSSRFAPLSYENHKGMTVVRGEVLVERQIEQLLSAGVPTVYVVTGYKAEQFDYLADKYGVRLLHNPDYLTRNNNASIWVARDVLANSYVCSADNYFCENPFEAEVDGTYYAAAWASGPTAEWCMTEGLDGFVDSVTIGGRDSWYMMGHAFWGEEFTRAFLSILEREYDLPETAGKLWESIYLEHLDVLKMRMRRYPDGVINEFDTLDELRAFDASYVDDTRSALIARAAAELGVRESDIVDVTAIKGQAATATGFGFTCKGRRYACTYGSGTLEEIGVASGQAGR